jgi:hypothetical protein
MSRQCNFILPKSFSYGFTYCMLAEGHVNEEHRDGHGVVGGKGWIPISQYSCLECGEAADAKDQAVIEVLEQVLKEAEVHWPTAVKYIRDLIEERR